MHIPNTNNLIGLQTYTQIVDGSVQLAEQGFISETVTNRQ